MCPDANTSDSYLSNRYDERGDLLRGRRAETGRGAGEGTQRGRGLSRRQRVLRGDARTELTSAGGHERGGQRDGPHKSALTNHRLSPGSCKQAACSTTKQLLSGAATFTSLRGIKFAQNDRHGYELRHFYRLPLSSPISSSSAPWVLRFH